MSELAVHMIMNAGITPSPRVITLSTDAGNVERFSLVGVRIAQRGPRPGDQETAYHRCTDARLYGHTASSMVQIINEDIELAGMERGRLDLNRDVILGFEPPP
jgi:hypothetical protein